MPQRECLDSTEFDYAEIQINFNFLFIKMYISVWYLIGLIRFIFLAPVWKPHIKKLKISMQMMIFIQKIVGICCTYAAIVDEMSGRNTIRNTVNKPRHHS